MPTPLTTAVLRHACPRCCRSLRDGVLTRTLLARFVQPAFLATILARADEGIRLRRKDSHIGVADSRINALAVNGSRGRLGARISGSDETGRIHTMIYWAKRRCDPGGEIPLMKLVGDLQLKLGAPHELMMLGSPPLTRKHFEVFIGVPQRELLDLFDGFTEIQENELPDKLIALVIREDEFDERFPAIAAKRIAAAKP
jgi:hypothetical protein